MRTSVVRFDPKLVPPAEAPVDVSGELDLPDDLLELASQLRDDAAHLAAHYPASAPLSAAPTAAPAATRRRGLPRWARIGAAVAAALLLLVSLAYRPTILPRETASPPVPTPASTTQLAVMEVVESHTTEPRATSPSAVGPRIQRLPWAPTPALNEVSGPELEGLLDLWQNDQHVTETRISI